MLTQQDDTRPLARSMQPIVEAIGFDAALRLSSHFGGTRVLVLADPHERDNVTRVIGIIAARALVASIGAGVLEIPRCMAWLLARRNEEIIARSLSGETQSDLALRFTLTERQIRNILGADAREFQYTATATAAQGDFFTSPTSSTESSAP